MQTRKNHFPTGSKRRFAEIIALLSISLAASTSLAASARATNASADVNADIEAGILVSMRYDADSRPVCPAAECGTVRWPEGARVQSNTPHIVRERAFARRMASTSAAAPASAWVPIANQPTLTDTRDRPSGIDYRIDTKPTVTAVIHNEDDAEFVQVLVLYTITPAYL